MGVVLTQQVMGDATSSNLQELMDLTCACVAQMLKGKKPQQIRDLFGIKNDFTPDEEQRIRTLCKIDPES